MTNTADTSIFWIQDGPSFCTAESTTHPYSEWFLDHEDGLGWHLYLVRTDPEGTTPDQDYGYFTSVAAAQERAQLIEDGEW